MATAAEVDELTLKLSKAEQAALLTIAEYGLDAIREFNACRGSRFGDPG